MQPTTNTPFERFAFTGVIVLMILCPVAAFVPFGALFYAVGFPVFCIMCALKIERDHIKALAKAEAELSEIMVSDMRTLPQNWEATGTVFIAESVVIANDYLKSFLWCFRKLVGGESKSLSRLLARARREATVRVLRKAKECGANVVWNIRYETSAVHSIFTKDTSNSMITGVEILAFATAFNVTAE